MRDASASDARELGSRLDEERAAQSAGSGTFVDCVGILLAAAMAALLLRPFQNLPFVDDWVYAWSVQHLLETGRLEVLDFSDNLHVVHTLWGALFSLPFGFSFTAVRVSTWAAAGVGLCAQYLLLRELDVPRPDARLGTAALGLFPTFAMLGVTFMTDVPFITLTVLGSLAMVRALRHHRVTWLVAAAACAALAGGVRAVAVVTPVAMALALVFGGDGWGRRRARWALALAPLAVFVALGVWWRAHTFHVADLTWIQGSASNRIALAEWALPLLPRMSIETLALVAGPLGLALLPFALAGLHGPLLRRTFVTAAALGAVLVTCYLAGVRFTLPLSSGQMWAFGELGGTAALVPGYARPPVPAAVSWIALALGVWALSFAMTAVVAKAAWKPGEAFLLWSIAGHGGLMALLWLVHDRYVVVLVPLAIAVLLSARPALNRRVAAGALVAFALTTAAGVTDHLRYNRALWQAVDAARAAGIAERDLNGGYMVNGWLQYAHPARAHRDAEGNVDVAWVNGADDPPYRIANHPREGWTILGTFPYRRWLGPHGQLYLLRAPHAPARSHARS